MRFKDAHRKAAYLLILLSVGAVMTGIYHYRINPKHQSDTKHELQYLFGFFIAAFLVDRYARYSHKNDTKFVTDQKNSLRIFTA